MATRAPEETRALIAVDASSSTDSRSVDSPSAWACENTCCALVVARSASPVTPSSRWANRFELTLVEMYAPMIVMAMADSTTVMATVRMRSEPLQSLARRPGLAGYQSPASHQARPAALVCIHE